MFKWKKAAGILLAAVMAGSLAGCGESTAYAMTIDGEQINAGVYIYYSYASYVELTQTLSSEDSDLDISDDDAVKAVTMDNVSGEQWVKDRALRYCQEHVAVEQKCEELGLTLAEDEMTEIRDTVDTFWASYGETYEDNGMSSDSVQKVLENTYLQEKLFLYYYGVDGEEGVTDEEMRDYYVENNARVRFLRFNLTDGNGDALDDAGKADMMEMVEGYLEDLGQAQGSAEEMNAAMDAVQSDYNAYVTSISEEAAAATATSETDAEGNEIAATTTTVTTTETTTTTKTTTAAEETQEDGTSTVVAGDDAEVEETTTAADADTEETTSAATDENGETVTTTTTDPYANETVIARVTTDEDTNEEDLTYSPNEAVYQYIFGDEIEIGVPGIVEDEDAYYIVVRYDITDRMTDDDLWTEDTIENTVADKYWDSFEDMMEGWCDEQNVELNDRAIKRYDAFDIELDMSSAAY